MKPTLAIAVLVTAVLPTLAPAQGQQPAQPTPQERIANLKGWLEASQKQVRAYEWIETTVIRQGGAEKARIQKQCFYGPDGKLQKVQISQTAASENKGGPGLLGKLAAKKAEAKKQEVSEYMKKAVELAHAYVPPDPARIQQAAGAGKVSVTMVQPDRMVRIDIRDYLKPGDILSVSIELPTNRLVGLSVVSYLDEPSDAVNVLVTMGVLPDGTIYPAQINLDAKAKGVNVAVQNSGYRRK